MITAQLSYPSASSTSELAFSLYDKSRLGEKQGTKIIYSLFETLFLLEIGKLKLYDKNRECSFESVVKKAKKVDTRFTTKYVVFKDLRNKGYIVKTALKFGATFRVYKKGSKPGQEHALWLVHPVQEHEKQNWHDFAAQNRVATTTNKHILLGIVDDEHQVLYYEISWFKS